MLTRRQFIATSAAVVATPLIALAPEPVDPENLDPTKWYVVWHRPESGPPLRMGRLSGVTRYPAPKGTFLTLDGVRRGR